VLTQPTPSLLNVIRQQRLALAMVLAVMLLAGVNWILNPEDAGRSLGGMVTLPLLCLGVTFWYVRARRSARPSDADDESAMRRYFGAALTLAVLAVGFPQSARFGLNIWGHFGGHLGGPEFERRALGLTASAVYIVYGNALPKILTPLSMLPLHLAERVTRARRFVGAVWVVLGLVLAFAFLRMPLDVARALAPRVFIVSMVTVVGAIVWMNLGQGGDE
jgi:hypothetical protein